MAFTLPSDLAVNWQDGVGMIENAAFLNAVGALNNANKAAITTLVNGVANAVVATAETTTSASYADLATTTDQVTVTVGASGVVLVMIQSQASNTGGNYNYTGFALSGANTVAASDAYCIQAVCHAGGVYMQTGSTFMMTGLTAGSTTFKMKYKTNTGTATFANRRISVIPFP